MNPFDKEQIKKNRKIVIALLIVLIILLNIIFYFIDKLVVDSDYRLWSIIGATALFVLIILKAVNRFKVE